MSNDLVQFLPLLLLAILFWLLVLRPARRRQREFTGLQSQLEPGLRVMLASGIHGELVALHEDTVQLQIADGVVITVARQAVGRIVEPSDTTPDSGTEIEPE